jgi:glycosyltransferase involved in cell wall biosynthesis
MSKHPTPLVVYLEDHESWISYRVLGYDKVTLTQQTEQNISDLLPDDKSHPFRYESFIGLADAVVLIQDKLNADVPSWVYCATVMPSVDLDFFSPRAANSLLRKQYGVADNERVIVYPGGLNGFTRPAIETLCQAVGLINSQGFPCRLLRTGPFPLDFLDQLPSETVAAINDLGVIPRNELPDLLALADVFVQPGKIDPFEDLRLPGKLPELLAMGRPVIMPDVNIAHLFKDGIDVVLTQTGSAEEIAEKCVALFSDPQQAENIGKAGRLFAESYFEIKTQAEKLVNVYKIACENFNPAIAKEIWQIADKNTPVTLLLARKLKLLADTNLCVEAPKILKQHANYIELIQQRISGLEITITGLTQVVAERDEQITNLNREVAVRDEQISRLNGVIDETLGSTSWRLTRPVRYVGHQLLKMKTQTDKT